MTPYHLAGCAGRRHHRTAAGGHGAESAAIQCRCESSCHQDPDGGSLSRLVRPYSCPSCPCPFLPSLCLCTELRLTLLQRHLTSTALGAHVAHVARPLRQSLPAGTLVPLCVLPLGPLRSWRGARRGARRIAQMETGAAAHAASRWPRSRSALPASAPHPRLTPCCQPRLT